MIYPVRYIEGEWKRNNEIKGMEIGSQKFILNDLIKWEPRIGDYLPGPYEVITDEAGVKVVAGEGQKIIHEKLGKFDLAESIVEVGMRVVLPVGRRIGGGMGIEIKKELK